MRKINYSPGIVQYTEANCIRNEYHHYLRNNRLAEQVPNSIEIKRFISFCGVYITIAPRMVVVGSNRANSRAFVHSMSRVEETEKESSPRARKRRC